MAFNPDTYLAEKNAPVQSGGFDPDAYLASKQPAMESAPIEQPRERLTPASPFIGLGEAAMNMGSGIVSKVGSDIAGLGAIPLHAAGLIDTSPEDVKRMVQERGTYQPMTESGKLIAEYNPIALVGKGIGTVSDAAGNAVGGDAAGDTIRGAAGNFVREAIPQGLSIYGASRAAPRQINAAIEKVTPSGVPLIGKEGLVTKSIIDLNRARPGNVQGKTLLAEEALREMAKRTPNEIPQVIQALERSTKPIAPGSMPTSADAIARGNMGGKTRFGGQFVKLEENISRLPEANKILTDPRLHKEAVRAGILEKGAGSDKVYAKAENLRAANAKINYGAVKNFVFNADKEINALMQRPSVAKATEVAKIRMAEQGGKLTQMEALQSIKVALDKMISKPKDFGIEAMQLSDVVKTRNAFVSWLSKKAPLYEKANKIYMENSKPIAQMDLWRELRKQFINPKGDETPGSYMRALRDQQKTIKQATGYAKGKGFSQIFDKENSSLAAKLAAEMEAELAKKSMANEINLSGAGKMAEAIEPQIPPMLHTASTVSRWLISKIAKDADIEINVAAAKIMADPKMLASVLKTVKADNRGAFFKSIQDMASSKAMTVGAPQLATQNEQGE